MHIGVKLYNQAQILGGVNFQKRLCESQACMMQSYGHMRTMEQKHIFCTMKSLFQLIISFICIPFGYHSNSLTHCA